MNPGEAGRVKISMQVVLDVRPSRRVDDTSETAVQKPVRSVARAGVKFYILTSIVIAGI